MVKVKHRKQVRCDVCNKIIKTKKFRKLQVFEVSYDDVYVQGCMIGAEKDLDVCNDCVLDLNFRGVEK